MTKGSTDAKHKIFIKEMINGGHQNMAGMIAAYKKAYPQVKKDNTARSAAYRLLQNVAVWKAIDDGIKEREEVEKRAQLDEIDRQARERIATTNQLKAELSDIALGKHKRKRVIAFIDSKNKKVITGEVEEAPTRSDMIQAADKLFKVAGAYAPDVHKHEAGDSFLEVMKAITAKKRKSETNVSS